MSSLWAELRFPIDADPPLPLRVLRLRRRAAIPMSHLHSSFQAERTAQIPHGTYSRSVAESEAAGGLFCCCCPCKRRIFKTQRASVKVLQGWTTAPWAFLFFFFVFHHTASLMIRFSTTKNFYSVLFPRLLNIFFCFHLLPLLSLFWSFLTGPVRAVVVAHLNVTQTAVDIGVARFCFTDVGLSVCVCTCCV